MATKLGVYNTALRYCRERKVTLTESRESRRLLDDAWDASVENCLEEAQWKFATRTVKLDQDPDLTPQFGLQYAFSKPTDWVGTVAVCVDEYFDQPLLRYAHEGAYWYADLAEIYVKYVSNDASYGLDLSLWPASFADYVSAHLAFEIVGSLTHDDKVIDRVADILDKNRKKARNTDARQQPQKFPAPGQWVSSRARSGGDYRDRGNRNSLLG